ncbi:diphthine--ammonia ligase-like isoform X2 [Pecten maximus]|uniref:diphthine--ammonia ligase-like isoform X2 n=1 Tax=Pecten maximus TaxID=6579 RepID=UPI0014586B42|nr:diphthine--ammonia ligase-like isoform X2 [Pecten maximus]
MKTVALISGGKDSCYNMIQCVAEGHEIVALANLRPAVKDEMDSYMYQTVGHHAIDLYAEAMGLPLYRHTIQGVAKETGGDYVPTPQDEVEDLLVLLQKVQKEIEIEAVSVGAILSNYQRVRVENVCQRLGLTSLAYLWRRDQAELLNEMIGCGVTAVLIKVASLGLDPKKHLGKTLAEMQPELHRMHTKFQLNVCGEGGEYETFTLDCPLFKKRIVLDDPEMVIHSDDAFSPVGYLNLKKAHLEDKETDIEMSQHERIQGLHMRTSVDVYHDLLQEGEDDMCDNIPVESSPHIGNNDIIPDEFNLSVKSMGKNLWVTGVVARGDTDIQEATRAAMEQVKAAISDVGKDWEMSKLALVCLYVQRMEDFAKVNSVYKTYFELNPPVRVCVQASLPKNIALLMDCYGCKTADRTTMHVQGISHWAPANIGPYSQAVTVDGRIFVAGQIAMVPGSLKIIQGGITTESRLSLRHVGRVLDAQSSGCALTDVVNVVCYITSHSYMDIAKQEWTRALAACHESDDSVVRTDGMSSPSVICVVIPYLPRNAKVEWQVTAFTPGTEVKESTENYKFGDYSSTIRCVTSCAGIPGFSCTGYTDLNAPSLPDDMGDAVRCLCMCYRKVTSSLYPTEGCVPPLRIFYRSSQYRYAELCQAFTAALQQGGGEPVNFALVPVSDLPTSHSVFTYCQ